MYLFNILDYNLILLNYFMIQVVLALATRSSVRVGPLIPLAYITMIFFLIFPHILAYAVNFLTQSYNHPFLQKALFPFIGECCWKPRPAFQVFSFLWTFVASRPF